MNEIDVEVVTLENDKDYIVVDKISDYVYLVNETEPDDFCIRKIEIEGDEEYFVGLDNEIEFDKALLEFSKKHKNLL